MTRQTNYVTPKAAEEWIKVKTKRATYTKGPWKVDDSDGYCRVVAPVEGSGIELEYLVCEMMGPIEEQHAHGALVAAAPALLEALKLMLQSHDRTCTGEDCGIMGVDMARAAITLAEQGEGK